MAPSFFEQIDYIRVGGRRKRRAVTTICPAIDSGIKSIIVGPFLEEGRIRNVAKFSKYRVSVRAYNGAGNGPQSQAVEINTPEGSEFVFSFHGRL